MGDDLKLREVLLREVFADVRKDGRIPWVNDKEGGEDSITVDEICIHGKSWISHYLTKDEATGLWECDSSGESEEWCRDCEPDCDCGKPHSHICPSCKGPWPKFSEERLIAAWKNHEDLLNDTKCPKCGHAWTFSMEEMKQLHPEVVAKWERGDESAEDESYRRFAEKRDAIVDALHRAYEPCPKDGCPADVDIIELEDGKFAGTGGPIHKCDFDDLDQRFPGEFAIDTTDLPDKPVHNLKPAPARPMRNGRPIGRNSQCPCGSDKKYKRCCEKLTKS